MQVNYIDLVINACIYYIRFNDPDGKVGRGH